MPYTRSHIPDASDNAGAQRTIDPLAHLLDGAIAGDPADVRELLRALSPEVVRVARAILGASSSGCDDAVQDSLLRIVHALPSFRRDCSARRFANRIAARTALLSRRRAHSTSRNENEAADANDPTHAATPHDQSLLQRQQRLLDRLLDELPQVQAEALALRFVLGYSLEETATTLQAPMNTVRSRIRLAKETLRQRIAADPTLAELFRGDV